MEDSDRLALFGLTFGVGLGLWATVGGGGPGMGVFAVLIIVVSAVWLGVSFF